MNLWLNEEQLFELTGYHTKSKQKEALAQMKIPFRSRPADGFPLVELSMFDVKNHHLTKAEKRREPRMEFIR